ncbi:MAG TPA: hypothetical protein VGJ94_02195 [Syntrophorhabdaceae bacterium]
MTLEEYRARMQELTPGEFQKFNEDFGGGPESVEQRVREFVDEPKYERRICQLLSLETEAEKVTAAVLKSADAAGQSAACARLSMRWSIISCIAAIAAVTVAVIGLFLKR